MKRPHQTPRRSAVTFRQHPIHPMLVVFPIAFLMTVPVTDLVYLWRGEPFWAEASRWLLTGGVGLGVLAALIGFTDFVAVPAVRRHVTGWSHMLAALMLLALAACNLRVRWDAAAALLPWGVWLSLLTAGLVMIAAWLGGSLTFRHRIGVYEHRDD